ncbi:MULTISPECIES: CoA ester lyase [unclassified Rhizobium]|uniref:HpcH/HpaI aldolase/citrate lyase family protein n=1 Tax=unclassified Rhizobium TaxID=2613769 RepID=UPI00244EAB86|nr:MULTISPECIES: CoA ester lyase [unclassified Rhizobium]
MAAAAASDSPALRQHPDCAVFVRVNPLESDDLEKDLGVLASGLPDGLVLPKAEGAASVRALSVRVSKMAGAAVPILPIATEAPAAIFQLGTYAQVGPEICGLTWGAEDLPAAIGALSAREADGGYTDPYRMVRSLALFAAHAAGVAAIETVYPDIRDLSGLEAYARRGRRDGFTGMLAIHPAQVEVINRAFTPNEEEIARAERIIAAFAANPEAGAIQLDGRMLDRPHLKLALAVTEAARGF